MENNIQGTVIVKYPPYHHLSFLNGNYKLLEKSSNTTISIRGMVTLDIGFQNNSNIEIKTFDKDQKYISIQDAILDHLCQAQELLDKHVSGIHGLFHKESKRHMNFVKQLVSAYPDTSFEMLEEDLNELWKRTVI